MFKRFLLAFATLATLGTLTTSGSAAEYHVAISGIDSNPGSAAMPFRTIQHAANAAQPGDTVTVHAGIYRERIDPPRGGKSDAQRIVYQAAPGEKVTITGSEPVKNWAKVGGDVWKTSVPNSFFGEFNPFADRIWGDWFGGPGVRHTGCVYWGETGLLEAHHYGELFKPAPSPLWYAVVDGTKEPKPSNWLLNLSKIWVGSREILASEFADKKGTGVYNVASEGGKTCVGYIKEGTWLRYDNVDFGNKTETVQLRTTLAGCSGGLIELRLDKVDGELIGTAEGDGRLAWKTFPATIKPVSGVHSLFLVFRPIAEEFTPPKDGMTDIYAQFPGVDPNRVETEVNVRQTVFTPSKTGINYLTVRGFDLRNAATPWAPPTAGQIGLITAYWCKGWIIENNQVSNSICSGICLGKNHDEFDNASTRSSTDPSIDEYYKDGTRAYQRTVDRAIANGWNRETIGSHVVRKNVVSFCGMAGIVGSFGGAFSTISDNVVHDINYDHRLGGEEMAGIKFHGPVDSTIERNHVYRTCRGMWLDWMVQGTRVSRNLLHDNPMDLMIEVSHGPVLVDNNLMLSGLSGTAQSLSITTSSGMAYVHNLFAGEIHTREVSGDPTKGRQTPVFKPHSTEIIDRRGGTGDDRFYNNIFLNKIAGIPTKAGVVTSCVMGGNVYLQKAEPNAVESNPVVDKETDPQLRLEEKSGEWHLSFKFQPSWMQTQRQLVTTELLGKTLIPGAVYDNPDGTPLVISQDYFGKPHAKENPAPGPFANPGEQVIQVW